VNSKDGMMFLAYSKN